MNVFSSGNPPHCFRLKPRRWAAWILARFGWGYHIATPPSPRCVIIVYPHTSNWDFVWGILVLWASGWPLNWVGKHTLFIGPFNWLFRRWGGIPVNRTSTGGFIERLTATMLEQEQMLLVIAPEGTRRLTDRWRSGFYRLALAAKVPIGLAYIDYGTRRAGIESYLNLSGDEQTDMAQIAHAYRNRKGYDQTKAAPIRLRLPEHTGAPPN